MTSYGEARLTAAPRANLVDDLTTTSGLILGYGLIVLIGGTVDTAGSAFAGDSAPNWTGSSTMFPPIVGLLANMVVAIFGVVSTFLGFQYLVSRWGSKTSALIGLGVALLAWFPFLVTVALIAFQADKGNVMSGPPLLVVGGVSQGDINSIALMGILGFWGYAGTVIGGVTFLQWKMYRCFAGYASTYTASYYRSRMLYYAFLMLMVGCLQVALGAFVQDIYGWGILAAPVITGPFFILYPAISIVVGVIQILYSFFMFYRSTTAGVGPSTGNRDGGLFAFQAVSWTVFLISMGAQVLGQTSLFTSNLPAIFISNVIGFVMFPIYLDVMAHTTPENVTQDMFSMSKTVQSGI